MQPKCFPSFSIEVRGKEAKVVHVKGICFTKIVGQFQICLSNFNSSENDSFHQLKLYFAKLGIPRRV